tara:strand:+ start:213 stop:476 length:264 start_codon:yes stop_codon:yes gene_type:complete
MENPENLSPEELKQKKEDMLTFYTESMPYLEAQLKYESMLSEIDETRLKRAQIQMAYAQMMAPPEPEDPVSEPEVKSKKRSLKKQSA